MVSMVPIMPRSLVGHRYEQCGRADGHAASADRFPGRRVRAAHGAPAVSSVDVVDQHVVGHIVGSGGGQHCRVAAATFRRGQVPVRRRAGVAEDQHVLVLVEGHVALDEPEGGSGERHRAVVVERRARGGAGGTAQRVVAPFCTAVKRG